mmetsp:Transcript_18072/g.45276  ORF Transcript_18072/g.45276 Transcript_18072/m.45276 type:complete len:260 (-) Transcript_18072:908-1687(-)
MLAGFPSFPPSASGRIRTNTRMFPFTSMYSLNRSFVRSTSKLRFCETFAAYVRASSIFFFHSSISAYFAISAAFTSLNSASVSCFRLVSFSISASSSSFVLLNTANLSFACRSFSRHLFSSASTSSFRCFASAIFASHVGLASARSFLYFSASASYCVRTSISCLSSSARVATPRFEASNCALSPCISSSKASFSCFRLASSLSFCCCSTRCCWCRERGRPEAFPAPGVPLFPGIALRGVPVRGGIPGPFPAPGDIPCW